MRKPIFKHAQVVKLARLLDMQYKPSELADEIGVTYDTVKRSYIPAGCPVVRDGSGRMWIHGLSFADWARAAIAEHKPKRREKLPANRAYCVSCRRVVAFPAKPEKIIPVNRWLEMAQATCPECGKKINKARGVIRK